MSSTENRETQAPDAQVPPQAAVASEDEVAVPSTGAEGEEVAPVTLILHLPERPLLPKTAAEQGVLVTSSELPLTLLPTDPLSDIRTTLNDVSDCYWLGAFVFRKAIRGDDNKPKKINGQPVLSDKLPEFTELHNIFDVTSENLDLYLTHVPYSEAEARTHFVRFRDLLQSNIPDPNALSLDNGLTVQDAIRHKDEWLKETKAISSAPSKQQKKKNASDKEEEENKTQPKSNEHLFADWAAGWKEVGTSALIPEQARKPRSTPPFLRHLALAAWNPPPQNLRLQGHFFYIHAITQENEVYYITASSNGFYVSNTTSSTFDPSPKPGAQFSASLHDLFSSLSPLFLQNFGALFQDPLTSRDLMAVVGILSTQGASPWLARRSTHHTDLLRSQMAYLLTGGTSPETLDAGRDWNEDLQNTRELPQTTPNDQQMRDRLLARINYDFTQAALRAVPRVAAGDVMAINPNDPTNAQMYVSNNLFISKAVDGMGSYPHLGGDEAARIAVSKDTAVLAMINTASVPGLSTLGTCLVDWKGERWVVQSIVPGLFRKHEDPPLDEGELAEVEAKAVARTTAAIAEAGAVAKAEVAKAEGRISETGELSLDNSSLEEMAIIYGAVEGPNKIRSDKVMHNLFGQVAKQLHLAEHDVQDQEGKSHTLWGSLECKGLLGSDGRRYVLDVARLNPVDIEWLEHDLSGKSVNSEHTIAHDYPHKFATLRLELVEAYWASAFRDWLAGQRSKLQAKTAELEGEDKTKAIEEFKVNPEEFKLEFNADAFVEYRVPAGEGSKEVSTKTVAASESDATVAAVRAASKWLRDNAIPRLITEAANGALQAMDGRALTKHLHMRGINMRYLGLIASLCSPEHKDRLQTPAETLDPGYQAYLDALQRVCEMEMVQRGAKRVFARMLKEARPDEQANATVHFLNCLLGGARNAHPEAVHVPTPFDLPTDAPAWVTFTPSSVASEVFEEVSKRFRYALASDYLEKAPKKQLLRAVCLANGIQLQLRDYDFEPKQVEDETSSPSGNGQLDQPGEGKKKRRRRAADKPKPNALATAAVLAAANANTTFVPADVLNIVPLLKDSAPRITYTDSMMDTGRVALARGEYELGLGLMQRAVATLEQIYGSIHPDVARAYGDFAQTVHTFAATRAMKESQARLAKEDGKEADLPELPEGLGDLLSFSQALQLQQQAVTIAERTIGLDAQETLFFYTNMAVMERLIHNNEQALLCQARALELWDLIHGTEHPESIHSINQVAATLLSMGRYEASLKISKVAYDLCQKVFGKESYHTAQAAYGLAEAYLYNQNLKMALDYAREALALMTARLGADDEQTKAANELAQLLTAAAVSNARQEKMLNERAAALAQARPPASSVSAGSLPRNALHSRNKAYSRAQRVGGGELTPEQAREALASMDINNLVEYIKNPNLEAQAGKKAQASKSNADANGNGKSRR